LYEIHIISQFFFHKPNNLFRRDTIYRTQFRNMATQSNAQKHNNPFRRFSNMRRLAFFCFTWNNVTNPTFQWK